MNNSLMIENFLIFDKIEIDVKKFTVFIGPQASGKSVVAKMLYIFYHIPEFTFLTAIGGGKKRKLNENITKAFCEIFPQYAWNDKEFRICFTTDFGDICFNHMPKKALSFCVSDYYKQILQKIFTFASKEPVVDELEVGHMKRIREYVEGIRKILRDSEWGFINNAGSSLFIPAGRSFFASLENNVFSFLSNNIHIDYFLKEFGMIYERSKKRSISNIVNITKDSNPDDIFANICEKFILGTYFRRQQKDYIKNIKKALEIEVGDASSGQQELLPILFAIFDGPNALFVIEEIETHIFPSSQSDIVRYIVSTQNFNSNDKAFLFTTHSPYVLTTLNNLAYAGVIEARLRRNGNTSIMAKLDKIYPCQERIAKDSLGAYYFDKGEAINIIDEETGLINAEELDKISMTTNEKFSALIDLELQNQDSQNNPLEK